MNALRRWYVQGSLFSRLAMIVGFGLLLAAVISLWVSLPIVRSLASAVSDTKQIAGFGAGRLRLVELYKLRHHLVEEQVRKCPVSALPSECVVRWGDQNIQWTRTTNPTESKETLIWLSDTTLLWNHPEGSWMSLFPWDPVQPIVQEMSAWIATREHLGLVGDEVSWTFIWAMVGTTIFSGLICIGFLLFFTRQLRLRYLDMAQYIKSLGKGDVVPRPESLYGDDDISHLAMQIETLSLDLAAERQRAIEADRMATWQTMARKVAHEIKNPLMPISLVGEQMGTLAVKIPDSAFASMLAESSRVIREEIHSLDRMVREFTGFARLPKPELTLVDLRSVIMDFVVRNQARDGSSLVLLHDEQPMMAMLDKGMIHQILHNLVTNSKLAKAPVPVTVQLSLRMLGDFWCVDIQDDGPGVPEEVRAKMFDAYVTTRNTGDAVKGMGLGLTISRQIARDHGGSLELYRTSSHGTIMRLVIPRASENYDSK